MYSVMVVDDEKAIRENLPLAVDFEKYGFRVCATARNGEDALEKVKLYHPDLILLDVCMPVLDGLGFLEKLHDTEKEMPCIAMLSGYSDFEYARTAIRFGVRAYLTKPLEDEELIRILTELRSELDRKFQKQDDEVLAEKTGKLQKMYHAGDGEREEYRGYMLMHCVVLHPGPGADGYSVIRESIESRIPGGNAGFFRSRGGIISYLVPFRLLEDYQHSITLFARHVLHHIKKCGGECALLFDEEIFAERESTFRNDYDTHLYQMMTEIFWEENRIIMHRQKMPEESADRRLEQEDVYLDRMKRAIRESDEDGLAEVYEELIGEAEKKKLNIAFVQEINYRIYYSLMDLIQEEKNFELELSPLEWRDNPHFICCREWKELLWKQISMVFSYIESILSLKRSGIVEKVLTYMQNHFREPVLLKEVAEQFFVSPAYLGRCVQKATGVSFKQYLNDLRMEEAKRLLCCTDKLVYEIAEEVGFRESKYFIARFTAETGQTPAEYRKNGKERRLYATWETEQ